MAHLKISQVIPGGRNEVFEYLTDPKQLPFLLQPSIETEVLTPDVPLKRGTELHFNMSRLGLTQSVRFRIEDMLRGSRLTYRQIEGLFALWSHTIKFEDHGEKATLVTDLVDYQVPLGLFGFLADDLLIRRDMKHLLENRLLKAKNHFDTQR